MCCQELSGEQFGTCSKGPGDTASFDLKILSVGICTKAVAVHIKSSVQSCLFQSYFRSCNLQVT